MNSEEMTTRQNILNAGKREFLKKGFRAASLRSIVKEAGVTTGAFYGYFSSKEALFLALVKEPAEVFLSRYREAQEVFAELPPQEQTQELGKISGNCMDWMVEYIYEHFEQFKLILCCAEGTAYEHFIHEMVRIEVEATHRFVSVLRSLGREVKEMDQQLEHILVSGLFSGFFEMVRHDMPKQQAVGYVKELRDFYTAGWREVLGLQF